MIFTLIDGNSGKKIIDSQICEEDEENFIIPLGSDESLFKDVKKIEIYDADNVPHALLFTIENPTFNVVEREGKELMKGGKCKK